MEIKIDEAILIRKKLLNRFHIICVNNNIKYSLGYGTLLGAIRHKDMIPWDDDIDVIMSRTEYDKLWSLRQEFETEGFSLQNHKNDPSIKSKITYYTNIQTESLLFGIKGPGVHIDVYPVDFVPQNFFQRYTLYIRRYILLIFIRGNFLFPHAHKGLKKLIVSLIKSCSSIVNIDYALDKLQCISSYYSYKESCKYHCSSVLVESGKLQTFSVDIMDYFTEYQIADKKYMGVVDYNSILTSWYGEYMKLPPEKDRIITNTNKKYYWKELNAERI